jgi:HlyD family secretion protein
MNSANTEKDINTLLGSGPGRRRWTSYIGWAGGILVAVLLVLVAITVLRSKPGDAVARYEFASVTRGNLNVSVSATGNLAPTNKVDVGSELSGTVEAVLVQENDRVKKGQVLARLDTSKLHDEITRSEATLATAKAKLAQAEATLKESEANLGRLLEVSRLSGGKVPSKSEMATAEATFARSQADVSSQRAAVSEAQAQLSTAKINLDKASIRSPIDGVVLSRSVEPGQTVAAQLQVATLFTLAEDLRQMELKVYVDEADVGGVKPGQQAVFAVDAYPDRKYNASVSRVAFGSTTKDNVVTYSTVLKVKNDDLSLRPGMTATAGIATLHRNNVLLVPNAALRFTPASAGQQTNAKRSFVSRLVPGPPPSRGASAPNAAKGSSRQVWILRSGQPNAIPVTVGASDGQFTEVTSGEIKEGIQVITGSGAGPV